MRGGRPRTSDASARITSPTLSPSSINNRIRTADRRLMRSAAARSASASASVRISAVLEDSSAGRSISVSAASADSVPFAAAYAPNDVIAESRRATVAGLAPASSHSVR